MGSDISANYDAIAPVFIAGFWKVHSAVSRTTGQPVSLWLLDNEALLMKCKVKADRDNYLQTCIYSVQTMRRMRHPQILQIYEFIENPKQLAFAAEPVDCCLINETNLASDEIEYIGDQLATVLNFMHTSAKMAHLGLCPSAICLTKSLCVKLCAFNFCCQIAGDGGKVFPKYGEWTNSICCPLLDFSAPELTQNKTPTNMCDVFSFGAVITGCYLKRQLFACGSAYEMSRIVLGGVTVAPSGCPQAMSQLLKMCIGAVPESRPTFEVMLKSDAFSSLQLKVYRYLDAILTKQQADKFNFFKSLISSLKIFSPRMLRYKFMPLLMNETLEENRFGPVTIPLIFQIASMYDRREFTSDVLKPLGNLLTSTKPPEMCLAVFSVMKIILDRVDSDRHYDVVFPIFQAAIQSNDPRLQLVAIKYIPLLVVTIPATCIRSTILPKLTEILVSSTDEDIVCKTMNCFGECLDKIDHDSFAEIVVPKIQVAWRRMHSPKLGRAAAMILEQMKPSLDMTMRYTVPAISEIVAVSGVDPVTQLKLAQIGRASFDRIIAERKLEERASTWKEPVVDDLDEEIALLAKEQKEKMKPPKPKPKPPVKIVARPEPVEESHAPKWSAAAKPKPSVKAKPPPPPPPAEDKDDEGFWSDDAKDEDEAEIEDAILNGILTEPQHQRKAPAGRHPATAADIRSKFAKRPVVKHT